MTHNSRNNTPHNQGKSARPGILHLIADLENGWAAREVVDLAIQTHRAGWRPMVASSGGAMVLEAERAAVRHKRMPLGTRHFWSRWRARVQLEAVVQKEKPVLIHAHGFDMIGPALALANRNKIPLLLDLNDPAPVTNARLKLLQQAAQKQARFRVPSDYMVRHLRQDFRLATDFLYHVPAGIDMHWFDAARVTPERLQKLCHAWRLPETATSVLLMATPMAPGFGHVAVLESFAALQRDDVFLILVGEDNGHTGTHALVERTITRLKLEGRVIMPEHCPDWPAACWLSSLVIANNAMPRGVAMELLAMQALGRPAIVSDCGSNTEMVRPGETAWVVSPGDKAALGQALREAVGMDPARRTDLAIAKRDYVGSFYPMEFWRDAMFELYGAMLSLPMTMAAQDGSL